MLGAAFKPFWLEWDNWLSMCNFLFATPARGMLKTLPHQTH